MHEHFVIKKSHKHFIIMLFARKAPQSREVLCGKYCFRANYADLGLIFLNFQFLSVLCYVVPGT